MNFKNKIFATIFSASLLISLGATIGSGSKVIKATSDSDFTISEGIITAYNGAGGNVVIPDTISGQTVVGLGDNLFASNSSITGITLPSTLETIGRSALSTIPITTITIPSSVTTLGPSALANNASLESVIFEEGSQLETIGTDCFSSSALTSISLPASLVTLGEYAFKTCSSLLSVEFEENSQLTTIGKSCFVEDNFTSINIPDSVTLIGQEAFYTCMNLTTVTFSKNSKLTTIGSEAFYSTGIRSITIPATVMQIDSKALSSSLLDEVTFLGVPTNLDDSAFEDTSLGQVKVPSSWPAADKPVASTRWHGAYLYGTVNEFYATIGDVLALADEFPESIIDAWTNDVVNCYLENGDLTFKLDYGNYITFDLDTEVTKPSDEYYFYYVTGYFEIGFVVDDDVLLYITFEDLSSDDSYSAYEGNYLAPTEEEEEGDYHEILIGIAFDCYFKIGFYDGDTFCDFLFIIEDRADNEILEEFSINGIIEDVSEMIDGIREMACEFANLIHQLIRIATYINEIIALGKPLRILEVVNMFAEAFLPF